MTTQFFIGIDTKPTIFPLNPSMFATTTSWRIMSHNPGIVSIPFRTTAVGSSTETLPPGLIASCVFQFTALLHKGIGEQANQIVQLYYQYRITNRSALHAVSLPEHWREVVIHESLLLCWYIWNTFWGDSLELSLNYYTTQGRI